jgi:epoxyqueuosine reductase
MIETLHRWTAERGYRVGYGPVEVIDQARADVTGHHERGALDQGFWDGVLAAFVEPRPAQLSGAVVLVAVPAPAYLVAFEHPEGRLEALLPPTYFRYRATFEEVRQDLAANGLPGARVEHVDPPVKSVAARLGLVRYGRNNVTYADSLGSYIQLCGFVTDAVLPAPPGSEPPRLLDVCASCGICEAACPTGAIGGDRTLLHAERCLTYANEDAGDWPDWVGDDAHSCLVGCLECQRSCPANPELPVVATGMSFSAAETAALLHPDGSAGRPREVGIALKLAWLGLSYRESVLGRNLRALARRRSAAADPQVPRESQLTRIAPALPET